MKNKVRMLFIIALTATAILSIKPAIAVTELEHEHQWEVQDIDATGHGQRCGICSTYQHKSHDYNASKVCTVCGHVYEPPHVHDWQCNWANDGFHKMECIGCGKSETVTHSFDNANSCSVCGYKNHQHIFQYNGEKYGNVHGLKCTFCDSISSEDHIYGNDERCTVCGRSRPHEHRWRWDGKGYTSYYHTLCCTCGKTQQEKHILVWDKTNRDSRFHGVVCNVCGKSMTDVVHWFDDSYVNGERCITCGYEKVKHHWKYNNYFDDNGHEMFCSDCDSYILEKHNIGRNGKCIVCGYHAENDTNPETDPDEFNHNNSNSDESNSIKNESVSVEPEPSESIHSEKPKDPQPTELSLTKNESEIYKSTAPTPTPTKIALKELEDTPEDAAEEDSQTGDTAWIWIVGTGIVVGALGTVLFIRKRKNAKK